MALYYSPERAQEIRVGCGMTVSEAAQAYAGPGERWSSHAIQNVERATANPRASTLARLAEIYGVTVDAFFVEAEAPPVSAPRARGRPKKG